MRQDDKAQREIRRIAYSLWAEDGRPDGRDREHWERAKLIWSARNNDAAPDVAIENPGIAPELTDQDEDTARPSVARAPRLKH